MSKIEPIGKYIQLADERNTDLYISKLLGVTADKRYIPSVANINGTDLSKYKVIHQGQFACNLMHVSRDGVLPVAMYKGEPAIVSPAYPVFEVKNENELMPEYLHLYLSRPEFDREAVFYAMRGIRGSLDWEDFIEMKMPIPDINEQRKIVAEYQTIEKRIENNNCLIRALEQTAQNIYHHMFVENIDPENLPDGWRLETVKSFCKKITSGGTPLRTENSYWSHKDYRWLKTGEIKNNVIIDTEEYISEDGLQNSSAKIIPAGSISFAMYCADGVTGGQVAYLDCDTSTNQACCNMICKCKEDAAYLFFYFINRQIELKRIANGAAQANLSLTIVGAQPIIYFEDKSIVKELVQILDYIVKISHENFNLQRIKHLLLTKLA